MSEKIVPGLVGAAAMGVVFAAAMGVKHLRAPTPERVYTIKLNSALKDDQKTKLDADGEVLFAEGTLIVTNIEPTEFTSKHADIDVDSHEQIVVAELKENNETKFFEFTAAGEVFRSTDNKKYQKTATIAAT